MSKYTIAHLFSCRAPMLVLPVLFSGVVLSAADTEYEALDQLPAPVQATLKQEAKGAILTKFEKEETDGVVVYTAEIPGTKPDTIIEFTLSPAGKLLKTETEDTSEIPASTAAITTLGNLSAYRTLGVETLHLIEKKDFKAAVARITDLESAWDQAEEILRAKNSADWKILDKAIDKALGHVRATKPDVDACTKALKTMIGLCPLADAAGK